jgi:DNA polymerase-3 subunit gamma/tau
MSDDTAKPDPADAPGLALEGGAMKGGEGYRVLARKYRPQTFDDLIGQEAMVRTLRNAFDAGRIAHAFMLTGVRGIGKTTTARIVARGLNCIGPDGKGGPTISPCGVCEHCTSIAESRSVDVLEMDAASRTGIDDIREIIDGARYTPVSARYKIYIIDEVHMLSKAAFNGLLKTLEEPPAHVKFIFATTEIRKVPVTVLSRCQRFDLKRIEAETLIEYLGTIAEKEGAAPERGALGLIARAAEGSARDALSLLDQALAHGTKADDGTVMVSEDEVRDMLGLADRARVLDLLNLVMEGDTKGALAELQDQYERGADPIVVLNDLLDLAHWLTRLKIVPDADDDATLPPEEIQRGKDMADRLPINVLTRTWQMLLKSLKEAKDAPRPLAAAEMGIIRLAYAAKLKTPDEVIRMLEADAGNPLPDPPSGGPGGGGTSGGGTTARGASARGSGRPATNPQPVASAQHAVLLRTFEEVVALAEAHRDIRLKTELEDHVHLITFEMGRIEFRPGPRAPGDLAGRLGSQLEEWTGARWAISIAKEGGGPTLREVRENEWANAISDAKQDPLVAAAFEAFPDATVVDIFEAQDDFTHPAPGSADFALGEDDDDDL